MPVTNDFAVRDDRPLPVFIHSEIDDSGLDVYERAVYLTITRRAGNRSSHYESVANMAKRLGIGTTKARQTLRALESYGLIVREERVGETSEYILTGPTSWKLPKPRATPGVGVPQREALGGATPGVAKGTPLKVLPGKVEEPSSAEPTVEAQNEPKREKSEDLVAELVEIWNNGCGNLAKTRVVSAEIERKVKALARRHGDDLRQLFIDGIDAVRNDPHWLGSRASVGKRKREGAAYGLVNYLRHIEDKANIVRDERGEAAAVGFPPGFAVGTSWWTKNHGAVLIVEVAPDGATARAKVVRPAAAGPGVGMSVVVRPDALKNQRHVAPGF